MAQRRLTVAEIQANNKARAQGKLDMAVAKGKTPEEPTLSMAEMVAKSRRIREEAAKAREASEEEPKKKREDQAKALATSGAKK